MTAPLLERDAEQRVGVIGAGLAGLAAARTLEARGIGAVVFDKGRGPGGRSSTRRAAPFAFDHGAQYFTARSPAFRSVLDAWVADGVAARWEGRLVALREGTTFPVRGETERFVGVPGMNALAKHLAQGLDVRSSTRVASVQRRSHGWRLLAEDGAPLGEFARLVIAVPPAQAVALLADPSPLAARAARVRLRPCWAVLLGLTAPYPVDFDGAFCEESALSWVARNSSKPGRPGAEAWVLHASAGWTEAHLGEDAERVADLLTAELERITGRWLPAVQHRDVHRWRFALPHTEYRDGALVDRASGLALAGDAYDGGRIEGAYASGVAVAHGLS